jgi:predicted amidohydrolase YtcJ
MGTFRGSRRRVGAAIGAAAIAAALGIAACGGGTGPAPADTVLRGGYVYTVDAGDSVQQAVAVKDGRIVYVGSDAGASEHVGRRTQVVHLGGRMLMPGFVDGHLHPLAGGRALLLCDLKYQPLSRAALAAAIQVCLDATSDKEPDTWLEAVNWVRQATQAIDADPTRATLDALNTSRPIAVRSSDFHTVLANSRALALAGVTSTTPDPTGGEFARDGAGEPTGICEDAAGWLVTGVIPPDTDEGRLRQGRAALAAMRAQGVTTFLDAAAGPEQGHTFTALQAAGELTARAFLAVPLAADAAASSPAQAVADAKALAASFDQGEGGAAPNLRFRHVKVFADGVVNAPADTGALLEPYRINTGTESAPNWTPGFNRGNLYFPPEVMNPLMAEIARAGLDVHVHATGDRAVRAALDAVAHARAQVPAADFRPAISHNETVDPADDPRFKALDVTASFSFQWAQRAPYSVGETENHLGPQRFARMEPFGSLHNAGARVAYGSDWPIDPLDELLALKIGVTRAGDPESPNGFGPDFAGRINDDPALGRAAALRAITINSAHQLRMEGRVGSLEVGKYADLIVLEKNFMQMPEEELARNQVLLTMVGGRVVHALAPYERLVPAAVQEAHARSGVRPMRAIAGRAAVAYRRDARVHHGHKH